MAENDEIHRFDAAATWSGDGAGMGEVRVSDGRFAVPIAGATVLGGSGGKANPEELLLAAVAACFANTWAIFLKKLGLPLADPAVAVSGELGPDPAGGFRMVEGRDPRPRTRVAPRRGPAEGREDAPARREVLHHLEGRAGGDGAFRGDRRGRRGLARGRVRRP